MRTTRRRAVGDGRAAAVVLVGAVTLALVAAPGAAEPRAGAPGAPDGDTFSAAWSDDDARALLRRTRPQPVDLGAPGLSSEPTEITDSGIVIGYSSELRVPVHAWRWQDGSAVNLIGPGGDTFPVDVNERGEVAGRSYSDQGQQALLWQRDGALVVLAGPETGAWASAIDERGRVAGHLTRDGVTRAVLWHDGVTTDLGALGDGPVTAAFGDALNERGEVVGTSWVADRPHAFLWRDGVMTALPTPPGATSTAQAVDDRGRVLGDVVDPAGPDGPVLWEGDRMHLLDPDRRSGFTPVAMHEDGQVVGQGGASGTTPMVWDRRTGVRRLPLPGGVGGQVRGLGRPGLVVGATAPAGSLTWHAVVWVLGVPVPLGEQLPGHPRAWLSIADDVNDRGQVVGSLALNEPGTGDGYGRAVLWDLVPGR